VLLVVFVVLFFRTPVVAAPRAALIDRGAEAGTEAGTERERDGEREPSPSPAP
jgi:hypothetical protein